MAIKDELLSAEEIQQIRLKALKTIAPLKPATRAVHGRKRTHAGEALPPYYLVYFLLVELLEFPSGGRWEKVAWTIAVEFDESSALIEHRKMGLGIFSEATPKDEDVAQQIVALVKKGVDEAIPFFNHLASKAVQASELNVNNQSPWLFGRYQYLRDEFRRKLADAENRKGEVVRESNQTSNGTQYTSISFPSFRLRQEAGWLGVAAIEAFFSWTEHVLIHIAIVQGKISTGEEVAQLASDDWDVKVKTALGLMDATTKRLFDDLLVIRRQIRNYMAHGAFGKKGEAFQFHSAAGAVPVTLTDGRQRFALGGNPSFNEGAAIETAELFIRHLWSGNLAPAKMYIQDAGFPIILPYAKDGAYQAAMRSEAEMERFVEHIGRAMDDADNMDW